MNYKIGVLWFGLAALLSACAVSKPESFKQRDATEVLKILAPVTTESLKSWEHFVFDVEVTADGQALHQFSELFPRSAAESSTHVLRPATSIGTLDDVKQTQTMTGLWEEASLMREQATIYIDINLKDSGNTLTPEPQTIKAKLVCSEWAQGARSKYVKSSNTRLNQALKNNWYKDHTVDVHVPLPPYKVGAYWIIPVEIDLKKPDFNSNCL